MNPIFEEEDLKMKKLSENATKLQVLQNDMLRVIFGIDIRKHVNMKKVGENIKMMSINQLSCYHTLLEAYNMGIRRNVILMTRDYIVRLYCVIIVNN